MNGEKCDYNKMSPSPAYKNIYKLINLNEQLFITCPDAAINPK